MLSFALAVFFLLITPGPGVLSAAGVGAAYGLGVGLRFLIGLLIGANLAAVFVVSGLATLLLANPNFRTVLLIISVLFLATIAFRIAFSGTKLAFTDVVNQPGMLDGITLQLINPKVYTVQLALFSGFAFYPGNIIIETTVKFAILNLISTPIHLMWLFAGVLFNKIQLSKKTQTSINIVMAVSMLCAVALAIFLPNF